MELSRQVRLCTLFDVYAPLLTTKQREVLHDYLENNLSLSEVAEVSASSRQAVNDLLKRSIASLEMYEKKLAFVAKFAHLRERLSSICLDFQKGKIDNQKLLSKIKETMEDL